MIVEAFDPVNDVETHLGARWISELIDSFDLQRLEETLQRRIVPVIIRLVTTKDELVAARRDFALHEFNAIETKRLHQCQYFRL